ncbi:RluA family pseudouridine synthase [Saliterribacillus persicus]|uniref:Pseudouridine synthase n=1 Tax=Saliterribacillus persicus TaxID=930114 RepID=A0A368XBG5_9BACI|nr:RluA family pseudouridine synthase [Saliterribacillus persicus]RCW65302.1 23S rRNA pseudouridine1911/1915/1917 synthase [Saliterribacillus persicus]
MPKNQKDQKFQIKESIELLPFLLKVIDKSRNHVKGILGRGQVLVNQETVKQFNRSLKKGDTVTILNKAIEKHGMRGVSILHEDDDVIVIYKSAGLLSIASDKEKQLTAYRQLSTYVKDNEPGSRIFVVHRLDRETSGVMLFAKNEKAKRTLQDEWRANIKSRVYVAMVEGTLKDSEGTVTSWLKETKTHQMYSSQVENEGQKAITHWKVLSTNGKVTMLQVNLETGRKNQIRVHMKDLGCPIVGDRKYGAKTNELRRVGLHAKELTFKHPRTGKIISCEAPVPPSFLQAIKSK